MSVLPKDYKEPVISNYMKFEQGENVFRILSSVIVGMEYWKTGEDGNRVPIRKKPGEEILITDLEENPQTGQLDMPKHFWAMVVWNRNARKVQILEITQRTIQRAIKSLESNKKWGDAREYDITVTREGEGFETNYTVMPNPKETIEEEIAQAYAGMSIKLEALYKGEDPFATEKTDGKKLADDVEKAGL